MKILFVTTGVEPFETGGAQTHLYHLSRALKKIGHDIYIVRWMHEKDNFIGDKYTDEDGIKHFPIQREIFERQAQNAGDELSGKLLMKIDPDIVHLMKLSQLAFSFIRMAKQYEKPVFITALGFSFCSLGSLLRRDKTICDGQADYNKCLSCLLFGSSEHKILLKIAALFLFLGKHFHYLSKYSRRIKHILSYPRHYAEWQELCSLNPIVIAPSEAVSRTFILNGIRKENVFKMPYGIPDELIKLRQEKVTTGKLKIAYVGKISFYKGVHILVQAASIAAKQGASFELDIYGYLNPQKNNYHSQIIKMIQDLKLPDSVVIDFKGFFLQTQLPQIHANIDLIIVPSLWPENATIVVLEALSLGSPVGAAFIEGISEFIQPDCNGWFFERSGPEDLAQLIVSLSKKVEHVRAMSKNCHSILTIEQQAVKITLLYQQHIINGNHQKKI